MSVTVFVHAFNTETDLLEYSLQVYGNVIWIPSEELMNIGSIGSFEDNDHECVDKHDFDASDKMWRDEAFNHLVRLGDEFIASGFVGNVQNSAVQRSDIARALHLDDDLV